MPTTEMNADPQQMRTRVAELRLLSWFVFCARVAMVAVCADSVLKNPAHLFPFVKGVLPTLLLLSILPEIAARFAYRKKEEVRSKGNNWLIGKYTEEQLRSLVLETAASLPVRLGSPRIAISHHRGIAGWTWLSLFWPDWERRKTLWITEGSLHYLEADELKAVIAHEAAHHHPSNRCDTPGDWFLGDAALLCLLFWLGPDQYSWTIGWLAVLLVRALGDILVGDSRAETSRQIEHLCDLCASRWTSPEAVANALLKMGEEEELVETVLARAAKKLLYFRDVEMEELGSAFEEVRPFGRIFHENLFQHSARITEEIVNILQPSPKEPGANRKENEELRDLLENRRKGRRKRIKWRQFDSNGDGRLSESEVQCLCEALGNQPDRALFLSECEGNPKTHPGYRSRILFLQENRHG
ncbi:MAG: hypothetical protein HYU64_11570 [Armatimonadetes bacterium]|nr:hypothetical protein [Armatimonadota bacterium]